MARLDYRRLSRTTSGKADKVRGLTRRLAALAAVVVILPGCALTAPGSVAVGQWVNDRGEVVPESVVMARLQASDIALLGEVHDSEDIHRKQQAVLNAVDGPVVLAMEQLDLGEGHAAAMNADIDSQNARERAASGGFDFDGWGWNHYQGLFELATSRRWPLWPLNLPRSQAIAVAMAPEADWRDRLRRADIEAIERVSPRLELPSIAQASLINDMQQAHCGQMGREAARGMARAQVARDILMADALIRAHDERPGHRVVAVMGNQHARLDRGVGYWLEQSDRQEADDVVALGMWPINAVGSLSAITGAYDFVWIADPIERKAACGGG